MYAIRSYYEVERGERKARKEQVEKIAKALDLDEKELMVSHASCIDCGKCTSVCENKECITCGKCIVV